MKANSHRALLVADAHIKRRTWRNSPLLTGDASASLDRLSEWLESQTDRPDTLIMAGDWFDDNLPRPSDLEDSLMFQRRFRNVWGIRGNHDTALPSPAMLDAAGEGPGDGRDVRLLENTVLEPFGPSGTIVAGVTGAEGRDAALARLSELSEALRAADASRRLVLVLHLAFRHSMGLDGVWWLETEDVARLFPGRPVTVLCGHIHTRTTVHSRDGLVTVHVPGSPYPTSSQQMGLPCLATCVDLDTGELEDVPCDVRRYARCGLEEARETLDRLESPGQALRLPPCLRVVCTSETLDSVRALAGELAGRAVVIPDILQDGQSDSEDDGMDGPHGDLTSMEDAVEACTDSEELRRLCLKLLRSNDPLGEVSGWLDDWKVRRVQ